MNIISNAKEIADLVKKLDDEGLYKKMVKLEGEILELANENRKLRGQNQDLKEALEIREKLKFNPPFYFLPEDDVPLCPKCWEVSRRVVHTLSAFPMTQNPGSRLCPSCNTTYIR